MIAHVENQGIRGTCTPLTPTRSPNSWPTPYLKATIDELQTNKTKMGEKPKREPSVCWEDPGVPPQDHIYGQRHSFTDSHTPPSRVLLKTIACPFCQTETRKPKSLKRGVSPTSEAVWGSRVGTLAHGGQVYTGIHICVTPAVAYNWRQRLPRLASQKIRYGSGGGGGIRVLGPSAARTQKPALLRTHRVVGSMAVTAT